MKRPNYLLVGLVATTLWTSCKEKDEPKPDPVFEFTLDEAELPMTEGMRALTVESSSRWSISDDADWAELSIEGGDANVDKPTTVQLCYEANSGEARQVNITLTNQETKKTVSLTQSEYVTEGGGDEGGGDVTPPPAPTTTLEGLNEIVPGYGLINNQLTVSSAGNWTLKCDKPWVTFSKTSGTPCATTPINVRMDAEINYYDARTATVTYTAGGVVTKYVLTQEKYTRPTTAFRVGDPGIKFDESKYNTSDTYYQKMLEWKTCGTQQGIPSLTEQLGKVTKTFEPGTSCQEIKDYFYNNRNSAVIVLLKNGNYTFDQSVRLYSNAVLIGESRDGVKITVDPAIGTANPITLYAAKNAGVRNLWLHGGWLNEDGNNYPKYSYREAHVVQELKGDGMSGHIMINVKSSNGSQISNCYLDNVKITNSASHPIWLRGQHITVRDVEIDGAFNKDGGCQGYFFIGSSYSLITGCKITNIRHISMQGGECKKNVFYDNELEQELSFHSGDGGDNLIEFNRFYLRPDMHEGYNAIMGPWSTQHEVGGKNFIYNNRCKEDNGDRGGYTPWSDEQLYLGPYEVSSGGSNPNRHTNFRPVPATDIPAGGTLYPVLVN